MSADLQKFDVSELHEKLQSGRLVIGLSSAIPGFIRKDPGPGSVYFAPFYARDSWVKLPVAIIQEEVPASNARPAGHLSFTLKPGARKEKVLAELIDALTHANSPAASELSVCGRCKRDAKAQRREDAKKYWSLCVFESLRSILFWPLTASRPRSARALD